MPDLIRYQLQFAQDPNSGKRTRSWVKLIPMGEVIDYEGREIEFSQDHLAKVASETRRLYAYFDQKGIDHNGEPYRFPVWRNHRRSHDRDGDLLGVKLADKHGFNGLWGEFDWTEDTLDAIELGKVKHVSAGIIKEYQTEDGQTFGPVIREVSLTGDPYLHGIGTIQDTLSVTLSKQLETELTELDMEPEALMKLIQDTVSKAVTKAVSAAMAEVKDAEAEDDEDDKVEASNEPDDTDPETDGSEDDSEDVETDGDGDDADTSTTIPVDVDTSEAEAKLSRLKGIIDDIGSGLKGIDEDKLTRLSKLNTKEKGHQGNPETPEDVNLSYEQKIERIMKKNECSRLDAIELEMKQ